MGDAIKTYGRFRVHPDKILVRIYPIKAEVITDSGVKLWLPPSAQKREAKGRWVKILQVGKRILATYYGLYNVGDIVICNKYVDNIYGKEGKFKLGGVLVAVTEPSELLLHTQFEGDESEEEFLSRNGVRV
jgi:hypothetical protein